MNYLVCFWIFIAIVLGIIEVCTYSLTSIWGAISAVLCAVSVSLGLNIEYSIYLFIISTAILLLFTRPVVKKYLVKNTVPTNADRVIGSEGIVTRDLLLDNPGEVKVLGQFWTAVSENNTEIKEGTRIIVRSIDGAKVKVNITEN